MAGEESGLRGRATRFLPKPSLNIKDLDSNIALKIQTSLDTAPPERNWRAFVAAMTSKFPFSQRETEGIGMAVNRPNGSPTKDLWNHLGSRDFRVQDLIEFLDALGWEHLLLHLKPYEKIKVLSSPREKVKLHVGDSLTLTVSASGFPYPRFQWFKGNKEIQGSIESTLQILAVISSDSGSYCCRLHNSADRDKIVFTQWTSVNVVESPKEHEHDEEQRSWPGPAPCAPAIHVDVPAYAREITTPHVEMGGQLPQIVAQSEGVTATVGAPFTLYVSAVGAQPLEYCWMKNGSREVCNSQQYKVEHSSVVDTGSYECLVKNRFGEVRSSDIRVRVVLEPATTATCTLDILAHPKSCAIQKGGSALFICEAIGEQPINYQWFKDGRHLPGETGHQLIRPHLVSYDEEGSFQCRVWNRSSELLSAGASLRLDLGIPMAPTEERTVHTATDKIALLIGNYDYTGTDLLKAPKIDVQVLAELLRSMDFKVVSLLNLTLGEMEAAVVEFCNLLQGEGQGNSGVYGLFYFCGHGTEENGQCYLVPQDAPTGYSSSHCLCAQKVLQQMQDANPALCTMILDCCRIIPDNPPEAPLKSYLPRPKGNCVYLYATTLGMRAYEYEKRETILPLSHMYRKRPHEEVMMRVKEEPNGVLLKHLGGHLCRRKPVEAIFAQVREDIGRDVKVHKLQIPTMNTNLVEPNRSLADKILYTGHTEVFTRRTQMWRNAHVKPDNCSVHIKALGVTVDLEFYADFSNVLSIVLTVSDPGTTTDCHAWIVNLPPSLSVMDVGKLTNSPARTKIVLHDIQKLKEPLSLTINLQYKDAGRADRTYDHDPINIGLPLISALGLWKWERNHYTSNRIPTEQGDDPVYCNMSPGYVNAPPSHLGMLPGYSSVPSFPNSSFPNQPISCPSKDIKYVNISQHE